MLDVELGSQISTHSSSAMKTTASWVTSKNESKALAQSLQALKCMHTPCAYDFMEASGRICPSQMTLCSWRTEVRCAIWRFDINWKARNRKFQIWDKVICPANDRVVVGSE